MRKVLSKYRYELVSLTIAISIGVFHFWTDNKPVEFGSKAGGFADTLVRAVQIFEGKATDLQFRIRGPRKHHPDLVVVAIDEKSVQRFGLWPWPRQIIAQGIEKLQEAGVAGAGLDIVFTDPSLSAATEAYARALEQFDRQAAQDPKALIKLAGYRELLQKESSISPDAKLADAFKMATHVVQGVVLYPRGDKETFVEHRDQQAQILSTRVLSHVSGKVPGSVLEAVPLDQVPLWTNFSAQTPLPMIAQHTERMGYFNLWPDPDGTMRRLAPASRLENPPSIISSLTVQTAAAYFGSKPEVVFDRDLGRVIGVRLARDGKPVLVPISTSEPFSLINHVGPADVFHTISMVDVIEGRVGRKELEGKAALVGVTLVGNFDQRVTPYSEYEPGVYTQASFLSNILANDFLTRPSELRLIELLYIFFAALFLGRFVPRVQFAWKAAGVVILGAGWLVIDQYLFSHKGLQLATVLPTLNIVSVAFALIFMGYLSTDREKGRLRNTFQHYLNESVMEQMLAHPDKLQLGGEKKEMTVLFSDIRGFTTLSERMSPEALVKFINSYLTPMTRIVFDEGGTLDKYIGDALMAFWGAPIDQKDHAVRACRAAVRFVEELEKLKTQWRDQNLPQFDIGVGINSGQMVVGNMGSDVRFDYTVMGDAVNLASRLEGTNKEYETRLMCSEATYLLAKEEIIARRLGAVRVKGKRKPVKIYELRGLGKAAGNDLAAIEAFDKGLEAYAEQRWDEAEARFNEVLALWPEDPPSRRYLDEIASFRVQPPAPGWDGVYTATTK